LPEERQGRFLLEAQLFVLLSFQTNADRQPDNDGADDNN
jgi:hypothetical protein